MTVHVLDPTVEPEPAAASTATRLGGLDGTTLGLLANGKVNAGALLELVTEALRSRYRIRDVVVRVKASASQVAPGEMLDQLASQCDAVVTAIGD